MWKIVSQKQHRGIVVLAPSALNKRSALGRSFRTCISVAYRVIVFPYAAKSMRSFPWFCRCDSLCLEVLAQMETFHRRSLQRTLLATRIDVPNISSREGEE